LSPRNRADDRKEKEIANDEGKETAGWIRTLSAHGV
jgi:hypothetical protein